MNEMYAAEQINIPTELGSILKGLTKAAIRDKPSEADVNKWAANFFSTQCNRPVIFDENGKLTEEGRQAAPPSAAFIAGREQARAGEQQQQQQQQQAQQGGPDASGAGGDEEAEQKIVDALFDKYDQSQTNLIPKNVLPSLIMDLKAELSLAFTHEMMQEFVNQMPADEQGMVDLEEFRVAFFQGE